MWLPLSFLFLLLSGLAFSKQNILEREDSALTDDPLRRFQCSSCKTFAASGGMAQRDCIGHRVEPYLMSAGVLPCPAGTDVDGAGVAAAAHAVHQMNQRTRRGILLGVVMNFPGPGAV